MDEKENITSYEKLKRLMLPHLDSFNWFLKSGMHLAVKAVPTVYYRFKESDAVLQLYVEKVEIDKPMADGNILLPSTCRQAHRSYLGEMFITVGYKVTNLEGEELERGRFNKKSAGHFPIMLGSSLCHLTNFNQEQLIASREEEFELGGYFVINGLEKISRLLIVQRRNMMICQKKPRYRQTSPAFSQFACSIRCLRNDETVMTNTMHYLNNGEIKMRLTIDRNIIIIGLVPLLRALCEATDRVIFEKFLQGTHKDNFMVNCVVTMLKSAKSENVITQKNAIAYFGSYFKILLVKEHNCLDPESVTPEQITKILLDEYILVHCETNEEKFECLIQMARKLYDFVNGGHEEDNIDAATHQEILTVGSIFTPLLQFKLSIQLMIMRKKLSILKINRYKPQQMNFGAYFQPQGLCKTFQQFLSTGNLTKFNDFKQVSGYSILAERLNYIRFLAFFRSVHRGTFFQDLQTTTVRKLRPEGWGFFCPVHTPDGGPCGLLNHLTENCTITQSKESIKSSSVFCSVLLNLGMTLPYTLGNTSEHLPVFLDGKVIGFLAESLVDMFELRLRQLKSDDNELDVPRNLEIAIFRSGGRLWPSVNLYSGRARLLRPVINLKTGKKEFIGTMEQLCLQIAVTPDELNNSSSFTHVEISPTMIFSLVASLTPFCENNQSPRNIYQCQMLKQTMGTSSHSFNFRSDNKVFRIQNPQSPITRNDNHENYGLDNFPTGTNAVVAVLAHTGYDMEDAMIINKSSWERGFGNGYMYKTMYIDLNEEFKDKMPSNTNSLKIFSNTRDDQPDVLFEPKLEEDGLPAIGTKIEKGQPLYCVWDPITNSHSVTLYKSGDLAYVENIMAIGFRSQQAGVDGGAPFLHKIQLQLRIPRVPTIGDKFSSRHGQKGVLSQLWPQVDMPFSESGMSPDLLINPNAFPSRMTIGMLIESMAGKAGSLHGIAQNSTPFQYSEDKPAVDHFGKQLLKAGYNYYGNEVMYSGISGEEFKVDIFFGVVYYQRLRHMVNDKYQVRSTGTRTQIHRQPVGGRKRGGGIRFGEMERDSMLAHGASFLLHDRLCFSSDVHKAYICSGCGSIITPTPCGEREDENIAEKADDGRPMNCSYCKATSNGPYVAVIRPVPMPYVTRYLASELMAMNIRLFFDVKKMEL